MLASPTHCALLMTLCGSLLGCGPSGHGHEPGDGGHAPHAKGDHAPHAKGDHATVSHRFDDADKWAKVFDDPERDAWQKPAELVAALAIKPGSTVADIGAGTGYFNPHLAKVVGAQGAVIAVDIEQSLVDHMTERATREATPNVTARLGAVDDPKLSPGEVDLILLVDTYHHIDGRTAYFSALRKALRPGGRLAVVDFKPGDLPVGPPPDHRIAQSKVVSELTASGWEQQPTKDLLPYQFVAVFTVQENK